MLGVRSGGPAPVWTGLPGGSPGIRLPAGSPDSGSPSGLPDGMPVGRGPAAGGPAGGAGRKPLAGSLGRLRVRPPRLRSAGCGLPAAPPVRGCPGAPAGTRPLGESPGISLPYGSLDMRPPDGGFSIAIPLPWRTHPVTGLGGHGVVPPRSRTGRRVLVTTRNVRPHRQFRRSRPAGFTDMLAGRQRGPGPVWGQGRSGSDKRDALPSRRGCKGPSRRNVLFDPVPRSFWPAGGAGPRAVTAASKPSR